MLEVICLFPRCLLREAPSPRRAEVNEYTPIPRMHLKGGKKGKRKENVRQCCSFKVAGKESADSALSGDGERERGGREGERGRRLRGKGREREREEREKGRERGEEEREREGEG